MKPILLITFILFIITPPPKSIIANPFASKISTKSPVKKKSPSKKIVYKGYALINNQKFAFIQLGSTQYTLKRGQKLQNLVVLKITPESLQYSVDGKILRISIKKNQE